MSLLSLSLNKAKALAPCLKLDPTDKAATALLDKGKKFAKQGKILVAVAKFAHALDVDSRFRFEEPEEYAQRLVE